ncbi:hypothetical protein F2Q70_00018144 [Brassica cretica]|uniref:Uncharacterized protein n=1 Tax=Brassica cretica TaxID=69181 RepID=A0A8S9HZB2_BRACR|nr:hypothetical protein F2Q70_00018144 [Brassica cretica]
MSELRKVTIQYINIDDPIERAARIQIVLQGEEEGLMANTAAKIIAAATSNLSARQDQSAPSPMNQAPSLLVQQEATSADIPESSNACNNRPHQAARMRTGASPRNWAGASTRMRNLLRIHSSPERHVFPHASPIPSHQARAPRNGPRGGNNRKGNLQDNFNALTPRNSSENATLITNSSKDPFESRPQSPMKGTPNNLSSETTSHNHGGT